MFPVRGPTKDCGISHSCPAPLSSQSNGTQMREAPGRDERERLGQSDRKYTEDQRDNQISEIRSGYTGRQGIVYIATTPGHYKLHLSLYII